MQLTMENLERLLDLLHAIKVPRPVRNLKKSIIGYLECLLPSPDDASYAEIDVRTALAKEFVLRIRKNAARLSPRGFRKYVIPLFPALQECLKAANLDAVTRELAQRAAEAALEEVEQCEAQLVELSQGRDTLHLLRTLACHVHPRNRGRAAALFSATHRRLQALPRYSESREALISDSSSDAWRTIVNAINYLGSRYELRGGIVLELLWELMYLAGWRKKPRMPKGQHGQLADGLDKRLAGNKFRVFDPSWRHWRNAVAHGNIEPIVKDGLIQARIFDRSRDGVIVWDKVFRGQEVLAELVKAFDLLQEGGAYPVAIELLSAETQFDTLTEQEVRKLLGPLLPYIK